MIKIINKIIKKVIDDISKMIYNISIINKKENDKYVKRKNDTIVKCFRNRGR